MYDVSVTSLQLLRPRVEIVTLAYSYKVFDYRRLFSNILINVWLMCMVNLLHLSCSKQMALKQIHTWPPISERLSMSSRPSDATNQLSAAAMESRFWITEE